LIPAPTTILKNHLRTILHFKMHQGFETFQTC